MMLYGDLYGRSTSAADTILKGHETTQKLNKALSLSQAHSEASTSLAATKVGIEAMF